MDLREVMNSNASLTWFEVTARTSTNRSHTFARGNTLLTWGCRMPCSAAVSVEKMEFARIMGLRCMA